MTGDPQEDESNVRGKRVGEGPKILEGLRMEKRRSLGKGAKADWKSVRKRAD